jgi:hypothetical protein
MTELKRVTWKDVLGNPYNLGLFPELLYTGDFKPVVKNRYVRTIGMSKSEPDQLTQIVYDDEYLSQVLIQLVLKPLQVDMGDKYNLLVKAISKAYQVYKEEKEPLPGGRPKKP